MGEQQDSRLTDTPAWLNRAFSMFWCASLSAATALWVQRLTVAWLAWEITGSAFWLGLIATADLLPSILLGPPAGILADRVSRRRLTFLCQTGNIGIVLILAVLVGNGIQDPYWLLALAILNGVVASIQQPVRMSLMTALVAQEQISRAAALISITAYAARFIGPLIVGPVLAYNNAATGLYIAAVLYTPMVFVLPFLPVRDSLRQLSAWRGFSEEFVVGFRYATTDRAIAPVFLTFLLLSVFGRSVFELLPGIADGIFAEGASGFSWLATGVGVGTILACLWLAQRPETRCTFATLKGFIFIFGGTTLALSLATTFAPVVALAAVASFAMTASTIGSYAMVQSAVPDEIRGRVLGLYGALYRAAPAIGAIAMGWMAEHLGFRWPVAVGASICLVWWLTLKLTALRTSTRQEGAD